MPPMDLTVSGVSHRWPEPDTSQTGSRRAQPASYPHDGSTVDHGRTAAWVSDPEQSHATLPIARRARLVARTSDLDRSRPGPWHDLSGSAGNRLSTTCWSDEVERLQLAVHETPPVRRSHRIERWRDAFAPWSIRDHSSVGRVPSRDVRTAPRGTGSPAPGFGGPRRRLPADALTHRRDRGRARRDPRGAGRTTSARQAATATGNRQRRSHSPAHEGVATIETRAMMTSAPSAISPSGCRLPTPGWAVARP